MEKIELIQSLARWRELATAWNELLSQSPSNTIFLTWEWLFSWAECYLGRDRDLFVLAVFDQEELIGVAPWYRTHTQKDFLKYRQIRFLGSPEAASDYLDVFMKTGREKDVSYRIYDFLMKEAASRWDCLTFQDAPFGSAFFLHFMQRIQEAGKYAEINLGSVCPVSVCPPGSANYFEYISRKRRVRFNHDLKSLETHGGVHLQSTSSQEDFTGRLKEYFSFYQQIKCANDERFYRFMESFISRTRDRDVVELDLLSLQGKCIGGLLHLRHQNTLSMYLMATDKDVSPKLSVGHLLVGLSIKKAFSRNISAYDFLKGNEEYKFSWANTIRKSINVVVYGKRIIPLFVVMSRFLKYTAKIILR